MNELKFEHKVFRTSLVTGSGSPPKVGSEIMRRLGEEVTEVYEVTKVDLDGEDWKAEAVLVKRLTEISFKELRGTEDE